MKKTTVLLLTIMILSALILGACNLPEEQSQEDADATTVAETAAAVFTKAAETAAAAAPSATAVLPEATVTPIPTNTLYPTQAPTATATPIPCNRATFGKDVTYPDNTAVAPGEVFTKTWEIKNTGSCTWTSGYVLLFDSGDQMSAPATASITSGSVAPGATVSISVQLTAPTTPGTYQGNFKLRSPDNIVFGINTDGQGPFWVKVVVPSPTATATTVAKPDLYITKIEYVPPTFIKGDSITIKVSIYNGGNAASGAFTAAWWPAVGYGNPPTQCTWNIGSLVANGGIVKECTFTYDGCSTYTTYAIADTSDTVNETDETNNQLDKVQIVPCN